MAARKALPQIAACQRAQGARTEFRLGQAACVLGAPFEPCGFHVLSLALSASGGSHDGRRRRMGDDIGGGRQRPRAEDPEGNQLSPQSRPALCGVHGLHRLQGQFRGVQGDGARPLRNPEIRPAYLRQSDRPQARRLVSPQPRLLQLLHRPYHDERALRCAVRRTAAHACSAARATPHGPRGIDPGGDRRGGAAPHPQPRRGDRRSESVPCRRRGAQLRRKRQGAAARQVRKHQGATGGALGAALTIYHLYADRPRTVANTPDGMVGSYLGPEFDDGEMQTRLKAAGARYATLPRDRLLDMTARALADGKAVGWFQGRMEFGPRALGNRSILADPRDRHMQKKLNLKVKYRESFRPFAPSVLREQVSDWFDIEVDSPYMLMVAPVRERHRREMTSEEQRLFGIDKLNVPRSSIPAVTHVDYSARVQTVHRETNPLYHDLISRFHGLTGCPVLVNTSFNVRSEPIVCTPEDAFRCFMGSEIDVLAAGNCYLVKDEQDPALKLNYKDEFEPD